MITADVSTPSPRMAELEKKRELVRDLLGGTAAMVAAGEKWLPQHPGESDGNYSVRLHGNTLTNFTQQAVDKAASRIMSKEIGLNAVPPELEAVLENIDLQGRDLNAFAMDVLTQSFADGVSYILIDKPQTDGVQTVEQAKAKGVRPYAVHVQACCLLEVLSEIINGVQTITRVRIRECTMVPCDDWGYAERDQIRVLKRVEQDGKVSVVFELYEEQAVKNTAKKEWVKVAEGVTAMKSIALVAVYTKRVGFMEGEPPFQATAELNLDHWRVKSEQKNALTMNCFEMLAATGVPEEWSPEIGPAKVQRSADADAKFYYLSPTGSGVTLARDYLKDIEAQIDSAAATLRVENGGRVSATAAALDSEEGCAGLKAVAEAFGDSLELVLQHFAEMMGADATKAGEVEVNSDFGAKKGTDAGLQELGKARALGDISRSAYLSTLKWRGELPPEFDMDANEEELAAEGPTLGEMETPTKPADKGFMKPGPMGSK